MTPDAGVWLASIGFVSLISFMSLVGAATLVLRETVLRNALIVLVAFAAGALLGDAFLHLLPETVEASGELSLGTSFAVLAGVSTFFVLEKGLHWHHSHVGHSETVHPVAITNLVG